MIASSRVLVVDDEESVRLQLASLFRLKGYEVGVVSDGQEALELFLRQPYDIVICDLRMPRMDGMSLLAELNKLETDAAVIIMSAYGDLELAKEAVRQGAVDYFPKPYKNDEVLLRLSIAEQRLALQRDYHKLRKKIQRDHALGPILGNSPGMKAVLRTLEKIAEFKTTVLVTGESGTGKELIARAIHQTSPRTDKAFVAINCGAIPENLLESELFGFARGAFTDATRNKQGLFEDADGGTLFLDEVGELPLGLQVKLLRVLQDDEIRRLGDNRVRKVDVRILAATNRDLKEAVRSGGFREDLFYRLNVLNIHIPALRERPEDIPVFLEHFLRKYNQQLGRAVQGFEPASLKILLDYPWPGNVRELQNLVERAVILSEGEWISPELLTERMQAAVATLPRPTSPPLDPANLSVKRAVAALEEELIRRALQQTRGNRTKAALLLEISHRTLIYKLKDYHVDADQYAGDRSG